MSVRLPLRHGLSAPTGRRATAGPRVLARPSLVVMLLAFTLAGCIQPGALDGDDGLSPSPDLETLYDDDGRTTCRQSDLAPLGSSRFDVMDHDNLRVRYDISVDSGSAVLEIRDPNGVLVFERTARAGSDASGFEDVRTTSKGAWDVRLRCEPGAGTSDVSWDMIIEGERIERPSDAYDETETTGSG